jgi:hypothetical protein
MPERTMHQRIQDDEDHRLAMCGDLEADRDDPRVRFEREDFEQGKYDFIFAPARAERRANGGESPASTGSPPPTFASPPAIAGAFGGVASPHRTSDTGGGKAHDPNGSSLRGREGGGCSPRKVAAPATFDPNGDA